MGIDVRKSWFSVAGKLSYVCDALSHTETPLLGGLFCIPRGESERQVDLQARTIKKDKQAVLVAVVFFSRGGEVP